MIAVSVSSGQTHQISLGAQEVDTLRLDWSQRLDAGETITAASWQADGLTLADSGFDDTASWTKVSGGESGHAYGITALVDTSAGRRLQASVTVNVSLDPVGSEWIFPSKADALARMRASLASVSDALVDKSTITDDALWFRLQSAASELQGALGVPLTPTRVFGGHVDKNALTGLTGPYMVEPGYDLPPDFFAAGRWGGLQLRVRPVISIERFVFQHPALPQPVFEVPASWIILDHKYGMVNLVPQAITTTGPLSMFTVQAMAGGMNVPAMIQVDYTAGIDLRDPRYASVLDAVYQMANLRLLQSVVAPQSASVSADGLSQSVSVDIDRLSADMEERVRALRYKLLGPVWGAL